MALRFDVYDVCLEFTRDVLATNPADPKVLDTHIQERSRKLIMEESKINKEINKFLNAPPLSDDKAKAELESLIDRLEDLAGEPLSSEQRRLILAGRLEDLKETFKDFEFKGTTVFFWDKVAKLPRIGDHMVYGFLKDAAMFWGRRANFNRKNGAVISMDAKGNVSGAIGYTQSLINQDAKCDRQFINFDRDLPRDESGMPLYNQRSLRAQTAQGPRVTLAKSEFMPAGSKLAFSLKLPLGSQLTEETLKLLLDAGESIGFGQWRGAAHGLFSYSLAKRA